MAPDYVVLIVGTGTEIGKTWVGGSLLTRLRDRGVSVSARKPVQSHESGGGPTDADVLAHATGENPREVCPPKRWYEIPIAPPMAAEALGRPRYSIRDLVEELTWPDGAELGVVEAAGGVRSPLAADGDSVGLATLLSPDLVVLVADPRLGTVSTVRLSVAALVDHSLVVFLNRYDDADDLHRRNRAWLADHDGLDVITSIDTLADRLASSVR